MYAVKLTSAIACSAASIFSNVINAVLKHNDTVLSKNTQYASNN